MNRVIVCLSMLACSSAQAQLFNNPASVTPFATVQANAVVIDSIAGAQFAQRSGIDRCRIILSLNRSEPTFYEPTKAGYEVPWTRGPYVAGPAFHSDVWDNHVWEQRNTKGQWSGASAATDKIATSSGAVQKIASSSTSSSSSSSSVTVRSWNGNTTSESTVSTEVTINGKTYRTFSHELKTTPEPVEPQSYLDGTYYCPQ